MSERPEQALRDAVRPALVVFLGVRVAVFVLAAIAVGVITPQVGVDVPGWPAPLLGHGWHGAFAALERQDALWFLRIAASGYRAADGSAAFFPLYPLVIRIVSWIVGGRPLLAATLVSNGAFFGSLVVLYDLTVREFDDAIARRTILYLAIFPTAFFFLAPYSESLFLLLSLLAFREARRDRWVGAALSGVLAALTRSIGVMLAPALIAMAIERSRADGRSPWSRMAAGTSVLLAPITYLVWWSAANGDAFAPFVAQANWQREATFPLLTLWRAAAMALGAMGSTDPAYWIIDLVVAGVVILAVVIGWRRIPFPYLLYAGGSLLLPLCYPFPSRPLLSMPRFVAVLFPAFWVMADATEQRKIPHTAVVATFAAGLALLATLFMNWWYIF